MSAALSKLSSQSLRTKLIMCVVVFVFLAELVVMVPSVSKQRIDWLRARVETAYLVSVALEGPEGRMITENEAQMLFETADVLGVTAQRGDMQVLILTPDVDPHGAATLEYVNVDDMMPTTLIANAWATMFSTGDRLIQVTGHPNQDKNAILNVVVSQRALRNDLYVYARNILLISLLISTLTASLLYLALDRILIRPVQRLTGNMVAFEADPEKVSLIHVPSGRTDEIGAAEVSLASMQRTITDLLHSRRRLAAVGAGISKISHDLRNILASAQLMSDRLSKSDDPRVRKLSPRLIAALDRAITLSRDTLAFAGTDAARLKRASFDLNDLAQEVLDDTARMNIETINNVPPGTTINADRTQLYRSLFNLVRNAMEAMEPEPADATEGPADDSAGKVSIACEITEHGVAITIADSGPGLPEHAKADLFEPFKGSMKPGGTGLGIAISAEIARAHGGEMTLAKSDETGATFAITLPQNALTQKAA